MKCQAILAQWVHSRSLGCFVCFIQQSFGLFCVFVVELQRATSRELDHLEMASSPVFATPTVALWDLDGTLIDTGDLIVATFEHVLRERLGKDIPKAEIRSWFGEPLPATFARFSDDPAHIQELVDAYRSWNLQQHDALIREIAGVREVVARVAASGMAMAVVTSKKTSTAHLGLKACKLADFFPVVVGLDCTDKHKPLPEPALRALELLGETPGEHVVMVGDSPLDILCGRNAGCRTVAVGWTELERSHVNAAEPHVWAETPADLLTLLLGSGASAHPAESTLSAEPGAGVSPAPASVQVVA